jgi:hypothetical protein
MKNFFKREHAKLKEMSFAEKRWYIWEYYKLHIIGTIVGVIFFGSLINIWLNPPPDNFVYVAWLGVPASAERLDFLADELSVVIDDPENYAITITNYTQIEHSPGYNQAMQTRFFSWLQLGELDVIITTRMGVNEIAIEGLIRPVNEVVDYWNSRNPRNPLGDRITTLRAEDFVQFDEFIQFREDDEREIVAISLAGSPLLERAGIDSELAYLCLVVNSSRPLNITKVLEVLLYGA